MLKSSSVSSLFIQNLKEVKQIILWLKNGFGQDKINKKDLRREWPSLRTSQHEHITHCLGWFTMFRYYVTQFYLCAASLFCFFFFFFVIPVPARRDKLTHMEVLFHWRGVKQGEERMCCKSVQTTGSLSEMYWHGSRGKLRYLEVFTSYNIGFHIRLCSYSLRQQWRSLTPKCSRVEA